jgi:hypothetical protein
MTSARCFPSAFSKMAVVGVCLFAILPALAQEGDPAVWLSTGKASSSAYIDASAFCGTSGCGSQNFCSVVNQALHALPANGGVVDARGINAGGSNTCAGTTPYTGTYTITVPSILLLPSGTISIGKTWILPNASKIIGEGAGASGYAVTTLQTSSSFSGGWMIQMGPNSGSLTLTPCASAPLGHCTEIAVEDLTLQGAATVNGIINGQSQDMSYVKRVSMYQIGGIGLKVWQDSGNSGQNSGPYSDITFDAGTGASSTTVCAEILSISTRGLHGLNCTFENATGTPPPFAVQIGSSNNSVRDAHISGGFTDGIQVTSGASGTLLFNITGGSGVEYLIDLLSGNSAPNVSVMGASNGGSTYTLYDEMTSTKLNDSYLAMYVLGVSAVGGDGYSRFTTSVNPAAVPWGQSNGNPPSQCNKGALYSNTSSTGNLYVCTASNTWSPL